MKMVEVKTSELIGPALDCAVALAVGVDASVRMSNSGVIRAIVLGRENLHGGKEYLQTELKRGPFGRMKPGSLEVIGWVYAPSTDWSQGGPLLDAHCKGFGCVQDGRNGTWRAFGYGNGKAFDPDRQQRLASGPTILVAAMRAIVAAKLGDVVSVPAELMEQPK